MILRSRLGMAALAATVSSFGLCSPLLAQTTTQADTQADTAGAATNEPSDIIVTAQRRSERARDVPISLTALNADQLLSKGIQSSRALDQVTPGLLIAATGVYVQPAIRGISSSGTNAGEEANVALYIDDVYIPAQFAGAFQLADVDQVEVLKGPQGTLFGKNSTGGAIRIVTKKPSFDPVGSAMASYGFELNEVQLNGYVSAGLGKMFAMSLAANYNDDAGYVHNINPAARGKTADTHGYIVRGKLLFEPSDSFNATLAVDDSDSFNSQIFAYAPLNNNIVYRSLPGYLPVSRDDYEISASFNSRVKNKNIGASLTIDGRLGDLSLKSITAYRDADVSVQQDTDRINLVISSVQSYAQYNKSFSQELIANGDIASGLTATGGLYYFQSRSSAGFNTFSGNPSPQTSVARFVGRVKGTSYAAFADFTYRVTDRFVLTGGARYTEEKKVYDYRDDQRAGGLPLRTTHDENRWSNPTFRAVAQYYFNPTANAYLSYSTGFKSGVYNTLSAAINLVDPEKVRAWELGLKARLAPGTNITVAAFRYDYSNIQLQSYNINGTSVVLLLQNAAESKITGIDAELDFRLFDGMTINMGGSWLPKAEYTSFPNAQVFRPLPNGGNATLVNFDISGTRVVRSPRLTLNAGAQYETPLFGGFLGLAGNISYKSSYLLCAGEVDPGCRVDGTEIINSQVSWSPESRLYTVTVFGENLTSSLFPSSITTGVVGTVGSYSRPRQFGVRVNTRF